MAVNAEDAAVMLWVNVAWFQLSNINFRPRRPAIFARKFQKCLNPALTAHNYVLMPSCPVRNRTREGRILTLVRLVPCLRLTSYLTVGFRLAKRWIENN